MINLSIDDMELGTIVFRSQICLPYSPFDHPEKLYMCVQLRGKKKWQAIDKVSVKNLNKGRKFISTLKKDDTNVWLKCIKIKNCNCNSDINGTYYPIPITSRSRLFTHFCKNIVYVRNGIMNGNNARWLYYTSHWEMWISDTKSMLTRKGYGWVRQVMDEDNLFKRPWQIKKWKQWNGRNWQHTGNIKITLQQDKQAEIIKEQEKLIKVHLDVSTLLFNKLEKDERYALLQKSAFKTLFKKVELCGVCFSKAKIVKCIHFDCTGACEKCRNKKDDHCIACGKKQEIQCPVCLDLHSINYVKVFKCRHITCWKCYSNAFDSNKPIKNCPLCRKKI